MSKDQATPEQEIVQKSLEDFATSVQQLMLYPYQKEIMKHISEMDGVPLYSTTPQRDADSVTRMRGEAIHLLIVDDVDWPSGFKEALQEIKSINEVPVVIIDSISYDPYCKSFSGGLVHKLKSQYAEQQRAHEIFIKQKVEPEWQKLNRGRKKYGYR